MEFIKQLEFFVRENHIILFFINIILFFINIGVVVIMLRQYLLEKPKLDYKIEFERKVLLFYFFNNRKPAIYVYRVVAKTPGETNYSDEDRKRLNLKTGETILDFKETPDKLTRGSEPAEFRVPYSNISNNIVGIFVNENNKRKYEWNIKKKDVDKIKEVALTRNS